jgi:hypothetical protein
MYSLCHLDDFKFLADMIEHIRLPLKAGLEKTRFFFFKPSSEGFFGFFVFFGFFYIFAQKRESS